MATGFAEPIQQYKAEWREDQHPRGTAGEFADKPGDKSESESAVDSDGPSDEDLASIWNRALSSHKDLTDEELQHVLGFAAHLHGHHKESLARGEITPEQLSSLHGMIDGHVARLQQETERRRTNGDNQPVTTREGPTESLGSTNTRDSAGATAESGSESTHGATDKASSGTGEGIDAPPEGQPQSGTGSGADQPGPIQAMGGGTGRAGSSGPDITSRHTTAGEHVSRAPGPVKSLLESLHKLRDTRKTGKVETTELGPEYAREMYDHIKSLRLTGDNFGEVHDLSTELGHGALGYSSPAGNVVMVPPKFKGEDWKVRYVLPHESQTQAAQQQTVAPTSPSQPPLTPQSGEVVGKQGGSLEESSGFPWESGEQEAGIGPEVKQPEKPATPPVKQPKRAKGVSPNTKLGQAIIQAVGDDPADQEGFKQVVGEIYAEEDRQTRQRNNSLRELLSNFGYEGRDIGQFIRAVQRYEDADQFMRRSPIGKKFDQMLSFAQQYHPELIGTANTGGGSYSDPEASLFEQLKTGLQRPPQPYDELIISKALEQLSAGERSSQEHAARMASDPTYRSEWEEIQSRPFSRRGWKVRYCKWARQNLVRWYKYGKQLSFTFDEDEHPRATEKVTIEGTEYRGGEFIPKDKAEDATPAQAEKIEVVDKDTGETEPLEDKQETPEKQPVSDKTIKLADGTLVSKSKPFLVDGYRSVPVMSLGKVYPNSGWADKDSKPVNMVLWRYLEGPYAGRSEKAPFENAKPIEEPTDEPVNDNAPTPAEESKYADHVRLMSQFKMEPDPKDVWISRYRDHQEKMRQRQAPKEESQAVPIEAPTADLVSSDEPEDVSPEDVSGESSEPESPPIDSRAAADNATRRQLYDEEYQFARKSMIGNIGEDVLGSARHNVNAWRSLEESEREGTAEQFVTRDKLLKNEPHALAALADENPLSALAMHYAMRSFPAKPGYGKHYKPTPEEAKKDRKDYVEAYQRVKAKAEEIAELQDDPVTAAESLKQTVSDMITEFRGRLVKNETSGIFVHDRFNATANSLISLSKRLGRYRMSSAHVLAQTLAFGKAYKEKYGDEPMDREKSSGHVLDIMEGESLNKTFGRAGKGRDMTFSPAQQYVQIAERIGGPEVSAKSVDELSEILTNKMKMRAVQWGNSVSDDERQHHLTKATEALVDLADVLQLPMETISGNGQLALAIGARGKGSALAHYEPHMRIINLTRKKGVGSLAHEFGHFLDHYLNGMEVKNGAGTYMSQGRSRGSESDPVWTGMNHVRKAWDESGYQGRLNEKIDDLVRSGRMKHGSGGFTSSGYWTSAEEMFARTFERYVQRKLEQADRKNTYLAGIETKAYKSGGFWPTDEEVDKMSPAFEKLLDGIRSKHKP